ncbi:MAG: hypothetical protein COV29_00350 [Candidatus Yanofskybacteria bacterium CG10_big_fil_rev_8_21_14_0_10_36_16]|uniref:Uncharacterized protein n=1 Tax=Candidatus Yanofskybacteria bacterium CG10_big_fil_rev_8_21_14_0_10_36_16 TaxID=1975096 RepID=A0A2J0Q8N0_9BACT|nr:MAG: hypothetical protein COV29_00350 [Candidatus Yanofskybacteria bacterium CG10_big_fil_rev_8_21_14_0_10_36_16]
MSRTTSQDRMNQLLIKHYQGLMTTSERFELHRLLKEKYAYGVQMLEYRCPKCNTPLTFSWADGPACMWFTGGCGWTPHREDLV